MKRGSAHETNSERLFSCVPGLRQSQAPSAEKPKAQFLRSPHNKECHQTQELIRYQRYVQGSMIRILYTAAGRLGQPEGTTALPPLRESRALNEPLKIGQRRSRHAPTTHNLPLCLYFNTKSILYEAYHCNSNNYLLLRFLSSLCTLSGPGWPRASRICP